MRKSSVWVLCVLFVLTTAAFAAAQTTAAPAKQAAGSDMAKPADAGTATTTTSTTSTATATKTTKSSHKKTPSAKGEVTAMDATAKTLTVKGAKDSWTFSWDDKTVMSPKDWTPAVGDKVTVWYTTSGDTKMATKVAKGKAPAMKKSSK